MTAGLYSGKLWKRTLVLLGLAITVILVVSCGRGSRSEKPPIHLNPNMDNQPKYKAQSENRFFADGKTMRTPPDFTVARKELREDVRFYTGRDDQGNVVRVSPIPANPAGLERGRERFGIYCAVCHGIAGDGQGAILRYQYPIPPTSLHDDRILKMNAGEIFNIISNGIRNMPSYREQIPVKDRWYIIAYIRELQRLGAPTQLDSMNTSVETADQR